MTEGETAAREELLRELARVDAALSAVSEARGRRAEVAAALRAARARREADRHRALVALGLRAARIGAVCRGATEQVAARPRRCPGCDAGVVDPRGLALDAIAAQLGAPPAAWIVREDGLVALRPCAEVRERARRSRMLARGLGAACALVMLAALAATAAMLRPPPAAHLVSLSEVVPVGTRLAPIDVAPLPREAPHFFCRYPRPSMR